MSKSNTICMSVTWLMTLRLIPETSIDTYMVKRKTLKVFRPLRGEVEQADEFNGQFTDVFNKNEHSQVPLQYQWALFMNDVVSAAGVTKLLKGMNPSKDLGPDELHPRVLKELASELGPVLLTCSNNLLTWVKSPRNGL